MTGNHSFSTLYSVLTHVLLMITSSAMVGNMGMVSIKWNLLGFIHNFPHMLPFIGSKLCIYLYIFNKEIVFASAFLLAGRADIEALRAAIFLFSLC